MNKCLKILIAGLCIISISQSIYTMDKELLNYSMIAEKCATRIKKTEDNCMAFLNLGVNAGTTVWANRKWHYNPWKALTKFGLPYGDVATKVAGLLFNWTLKPFAHFIHTEHTAFGYRLPLSISDIRSQKFAAQAKVVAAVRRGDIVPAKVLDNPIFAGDKYIRKLMEKMVANKNNKIRTEDDIIPEEEMLVNGIPSEMQPIVLQMVAPELAKNLGLTKHGHVLLYGPPGTGKTVTARHIAGIAHVGLRPTSVTQCQNKYVGGSAHNIKNIFSEANNDVEILKAMPDDKKLFHARHQQLVAAQLIINMKITGNRKAAALKPNNAEQAALIQEAKNLEAQYKAIMHLPHSTVEEQNNWRTQLLHLAGIDENQEPKYHAACVVALDELDSAGRRDDKKHYPDITNALNEELDGLDKKSNKKIYVIGMSNLKDDIDPALKRAGRLERQICVGIPANAEERKQFIHFFTEEKHKFDQEVSGHIQEIADRTEGFSPADLDLLFRKALENALPYARMAKWQDIEVALQDMYEQKDVDKYTELSQLLRNDGENAKPILNPRQRLDFFHYFAGQRNMRGTYPVKKNVRQQLETQGVRTDLMKQTAFFSPNDIESVFKNASGLAMQQNHQKIQWQHMINALQRVRNKKLQEFSAIPGEPQMQQNAANARIAQQAPAEQAPDAPQEEHAVAAPVELPAEIDPAPEVPAQEHHAAVEQPNIIPGDQHHEEPLPEPQPTVVQAHPEEPVQQPQPAAQQAEQQAPAAQQQAPVAQPQAEQHIQPQQPAQDQAVHQAQPQPAAQEPAAQPNAEQHAIEQPKAQQTANNVTEPAVKPAEQPIVQPQPAQEQPAPQPAAPQTAQTESRVEAKDENQVFGSAAPANPKREDEYKQQGSLQTHALPDSSNVAVSPADDDGDAQNQESSSWWPSWLSW